MCRHAFLGGYCCFVLFPTVREEVSHITSPELLDSFLFCNVLLCSHPFKFCSFLIRRFNNLLSLQRDCAQCCSLWRTYSLSGVWIILASVEYCLLLLELYLESLDGFIFPLLLKPLPSVRHKEYFCLLCIFL